MKRTLFVLFGFAAGLVGSSFMVPTLTAASMPTVYLQDSDEDEEEEEGTDLEALTIGSKAPAIDVEHWVQDGEGAFKPVTKFKEGNVYIVEFWATWCGPCIASMPHIVETQAKYKDKGVQVVSISDEDLETVEEFLAKTVRGEDEKTYGDLTKSYCLTTDPDRSVYKSYMQAAGQNGIPTAFIVGKNGMVEWIGHPMEMDTPLEEVVAGKWDREKFALKMKAEKEVSIFMNKVVGKLRSGNEEEAMEMINEKIASSDSDELKNQLRSMKLSILMQTGGDEKEVIQTAREVLSGIKEPMSVNDLVWALYEMSVEGDLKDKKFLMELAGKAEKAATAAAKDQAWMILDTAGHLYYAAGDLDKAIEIQKKAVAAPGSDESEDVADFLKKLLAEKA